MNAPVASTCPAAADAGATDPRSLSVVIIARNEAARIGRCIASVDFATEVIVLDGGSTDDTVAIARAAGARVEVAADWPGFGAQKNRALALARCAWILSLDADEWVDAALAAEIGAVLAQPSPAPVYRMPRRSRYCGRVMRHGGWHPDYVTRLWQRGKARFSDDLVHERVLSEGGKPAPLSAPLDHDAFENFEQVLAKLNRYSSDGAAMMHARGAKGSVGRALLHGGWTFFRTYVLRRGFLDGRHGLLLAISNAEGSFYRYLKLMHLER